MVIVAIVAVCAGTVFAKSSFLKMFCLGEVEVNVDVEVEWSVGEVVTKMIVGKGQLLHL